jgi:hypothetical protein
VPLGVNEKDNCRVGEPRSPQPKEGVRLVLMNVIYLLTIRYIVGRCTWERVTYLEKWNYTLDLGDGEIRRGIVATNLHAEIPDAQRSGDAGEAGDVEFE